MSFAVSSASTTSGARARAVPTLCAPPAFKHYRRSTTSKAPRKRTFFLTMTRFNASLVSPVGAFTNNNVAMLEGRVCCEHFNEVPCGGNNGGDSGNGNNNGNNHNGFGPQGFDDEGGFWRALQSFGHALLCALALVTAVAIFPEASSAAASGFAARGVRASASSASTSAVRPRSKVMHVACKGSTLVVPLCDPKAVQPLPGRGKIVDAPIELSGRELAIINRRQYCVRESMLV